MRASAAIRRMAEPLPLSLVVITRDAADAIAACLASATFAAEALVVDSGSRDDTVEIARRRGARVARASRWRGLRPAEALRGRAGGARLGAVPGRRRARDAASSPRRSQRCFAAARRPRRVCARAPQPLSRPLACAWRRLSGLERAAVRPPARALDRRSGARARRGRRTGRAARRRPAARIGRVARRLHREAEPLHDAAGAGDARARRARGRRAHGAVAARAVPPLLRAEGSASSTARRASRTSRSARSRASSSTPSCGRCDAPSSAERDASGMRHRAARVLVTGAAGFIGMHAARALLDAGADRGRRRQLRSLLRRAAQGGAARDAARRAAAVSRSSASISPRPEPTARLFRDGAFTHVVHLAAQPGVRYSLTHPGRLLPQQRRRVRPRARRLPRTRASRIWSMRRVVGLRRESRAAVLRGPERRSSGQPVCRDQERRTS